MAPNVGERMPHEVVDVAVDPAVNGHVGVFRPESQIPSSADLRPAPTKLRKDNSGSARPVSHDNNGDDDQGRKRKSPKPATSSGGAPPSPPRVAVPRRRDVELPALCPGGAEPEVGRLQAYIQGLTHQRPSVYPQMVNVHSGKTVRFALRDNEYIPIGSGNFGVVYAGYILQDNTEVPVAIKLFKKLQWQSLDHVILEASLMTHASKMAPVPLCHGLVPLEDDGTSRFLGVAMVSEFIGDAKSFEVCTLSQLIESHREAVSTPMSDKRRVSKPTWYRLAMDLASAVQAVHDQDIVLNDLKVDNVVVKVDSWGSVKPYLVDFGAARVWGTELGFSTLYTLEQRQISLPYLAPELFEPGAYCTCRADRFSLGFLLHTLGWKLQLPVFTDLGNRCSAQYHANRLRVAQLNRELLRAVKAAQSFRRSAG